MVSSGRRGTAITVVQPQPIFLGDSAFSDRFAGVLKNYGENGFVYFLR